MPGPLGLFCRTARRDMPGLALVSESFSADLGVYQAVDESRLEHLPLAICQLTHLLRNRNALVRSVSTVSDRGVKRSVDKQDLVGFLAPLVFYAPDLQDLTPAPYSPFLCVGEKLVSA